MIISRLLEPAAKQATARGLDPETASHSLGAVLELGRVKAKEMYATLDWLGRTQPHIEAMLARRHLHDGNLVLYDLTSTYLEGRCGELARYGYSRDGRRGKLQIVFGVLCSAEGCPIAIEVFAGNVGDPDTLAAQISKIKDRFGLKRVVMVGDRGMITAARIEAELRPAGLIGSPRCERRPSRSWPPRIRPLQMSLFDERDLAEITSPDFPSERLIVCRNSALAAERTRKREELLAAIQQQLHHIQARVRRAANPLRGADKIGAAVGAVLNRRNVGKHFDYSTTDSDLRFARKTEQIAAEAALDGIYVLRTSLAQPAMPAADVVRAYKSLSQVEHFFRSAKTVDLEVRPVFHWTDPRVRAHVFLCMLAYYLEWHMRRALAPMLFDDHDRAAGEALRNFPVAKAQPLTRCQA